MRRLTPNFETLPSISTHSGPTRGSTCRCRPNTIAQGPTTGLPEIDYPFHDKSVTVTACGRICVRRKKVNRSTVFAGQKVGIKQIDDTLWLASFMAYDLGYFDEDACRLEPIANPFGKNLSPMSRE